MIKMDMIPPYDWLANVPPNYCMETSQQHFTALVGIHPTLGETSLQQRQNMTHTNTHLHCISTCTCRHTIQESILINAGLALDTEGLSEPLILPLQWRVRVCMCIREIAMARASSVTAVSGFHRRARTHVFPQCEGC